jgi:hypothetical protein
MSDVFTPKLTPDQQAAVDNAIRTGNPVAAIRLIRNATGCMLNDASNYVKRVRGGGLPLPVNQFHEADRWKLVAAYLASCHAATLESLPKSASKAARARLAQLCRDAAEYLNGTLIPRECTVPPAEAYITHAVTRCQKSASEFGGPVS